MKIIKLLSVSGAHKQLFSRHALNDKDSYSTKKKHLPVQRINFDDSTLHDSSHDKQSASRFHTPSKLRSTFKNGAKYSRIFSTRKPNDSRGNYQFFYIYLKIRNLNVIIYFFKFINSE